MQDFELKQCESERWIAWPKSRPGVVANGETEDDCIFNLEKMYKTILQYEKEIKEGDEYFKSLYK